jgi:hypothetical protein
LSTVSRRFTIHTSSTRFDTGHAWLGMILTRSPGASVQSFR